VKIRALTTYAVPPRWLFLKLETDEGVTGWGEPVIEGRVHTVAAAVEELSDYLIGKDPLRIEDHWQVLWKGGFYRGGPILASAVAGIDQALWDVAGKVWGAPVHQLLGGPVRDRMRVYCWIGGDRPGDVSEQAASVVERGSSAVKMNATARMLPIDSPSAVAEVVARARSVREVLGAERDLAVDFHGRVSAAMARRLLPLLEPVQPMFCEEPVLPEQLDALARVASSTSIPIATGERLYSRWDFEPVMPHIAVAQPDPSHAGGISEVRRIAAMAETSGVALAPHCPLGPIALAACLQLDFACPNALIQELSLGIHYNTDADLLDYLADTSVFDINEGCISRPAAPGLGIAIDEAAVTRAAGRADTWRSPVWRHADGGFAEW